MQFAQKLWAQLLRMTPAKSFSVQVEAGTGFEWVEIYAKCDWTAALERGPGTDWSWNDTGKAS